ncbi:MAG: DUF1801 domain-containing protein [Chloroflexota bacterium]
MQAYIEGIAPEFRPLFDRLHGLIVSALPDVSVVLSYQMPTYKMGQRRIHLAAWKHGISMYGSQPDRDAGFTARHPELKFGKATIRLRPEDAAAIPDAELAALLHAALSA